MEALLFRIINFAFSHWFVTCIFTIDVLAGVARGEGGGGAQTAKIFKVGQLRRNPRVIREKHITLIKDDKKNRGLQWIIKYNNANINCL
jgi:hypothetical protein